MKYYLGVDYFFFFEDFPHMGVSGAIASNSDGTANIYINTLYCQERQIQTIKHELRHLVKNHFYCDIMTIEEKELDADNLSDPFCIYSDDFASVEYIEECEVDVRLKKEIRDVFFNPPPGKIACFHSLESMKHYVNEMLKQKRASGDL